MKAFLNWSGGKDSGYCLYTAQKNGIPIEALVTGLSQGTDRISMHGVRRLLLEQQAASVQLPLYTIELPAQPGMDSYENLVSVSNRMLKEQGFTHAVSG